MTIFKITAYIIGYVGASLLLIGVVGTLLAVSILGSLCI